MREAVDAIVTHDQIGQSGGDGVEEAILNIPALVSAVRPGGVGINFPAFALVSVIQRTMSQRSILGGPRNRLLGAAHAGGGALGKLR